MRLPRMTTRRLMEVVAMVSVALGSAILSTRLWRRWEYYRWQLADHAAREVELRVRIEADFEFRHHGHQTWEYQEALSPDAVAQLHKDLNRETILRRKYEHATWRPWLTVPPDPPPSN